MPAEEMPPDAVPADQVPADRGPARRSSRGRFVLIPVAAVVVAASALLLAGRLDRGSLPAQNAVQAGHATAQVDGAAFRNRPVSVADRRLRRIGFAVRTRWRQSATVPVGLVIAVSPTGRLPLGSTVTVIGSRPAGGSGRLSPVRRHRHKGKHVPPGGPTSKAGSPKASSPPSPHPTATPAQAPLARRLPRLARTPPATRCRPAARVARLVPCRPAARRHRRAQPHGVVAAYRGQCARTAPSLPPLGEHTRTRGRWNINSDSDSDSRSNQDPGQHLSPIGHRAKRPPTKRPIIKPETHRTCARGQTAHKGVSPCSGIPKYQQRRAPIESSLCQRSAATRCFGRATSAPAVAPRDVIRR